MKRIKLTTPSPEVPLVRQTPGSKGIWGDCQFFVDKQTAEADWWFVIDMKNPETISCPPEHTVFITGEAEAVKKFHPKFLKQFGYVITSQRNITHPRPVFSQPGLPWHVGHIGGPSGIPSSEIHKYFTNYDTIKNYPVPEKKKLLSVISSRLATPGHLKRHAFILRLKEHFGDRMDFFDSKTNYIRDKWDGIAPYKYHLALENTSADDYWTEKISDAFLGYSYPFYYGAPNLDSYFSPKSFSKVDIGDPEAAIAMIETAEREGLYEKSTLEIARSREQVLNTYNIFPMMERFAKEHDQQKSSAIAITFMPEKYFIERDPVTKVKNLIKKIIRR